MRLEVALKKLQTHNRIYIVAKMFQDGVDFLRSKKKLRRRGTLLYKYLELRESNRR